MPEIHILGFALEQIPLFGFIGVAIIANIFPAIPEEVFLLTLGYLSHTAGDIFPFFKIAIFLIIGFCLIDSLVYYLALRGDKIIQFVLNKIFQINLDHKEAFLKKNVEKIIFLSRFLVHLRPLGPIIAAKVKYPYKKFLLINFLALSVYVTLVMGIGSYYSGRVQKILSGAHIMNNIFFGVLITITLIISMRALRIILINTIKNANDNKNKQIN